ncbi:hypothetical protein PT974_02414 [Cladobotryum mycophilum]|uniref:Alpha-galactosidase A n=1 Tax=Cladobotryum mycophilum TaxID=491253 RepID=A0ABR0SY22_9HYPO
MSQSTFGPVLVGILPPFPPGDWNDGYITKDPLNNGLIFSEYAKNKIDGINDLWHPTQIEFLDVAHPPFGQPIRIPYFETENAAYKWIDGKGIGPQFLGHLLEEGRAIGFILEDVEGATTAGPGDLLLCQDVLRKLHPMGIKHGDINKYNFLVRKEEAVVVDFETSQRDCDKDELGAEYRDLE